MTQLIKDFRAIFLSGKPLIDLRAPCEFALGAFPSATSLPLMTDQQRHLVGLCYKEKGQQKAIELGHELLDSRARQQLVNAWKKYADFHANDCYMYCFRGGLRSKTSQQWLSQAGTDLAIVDGGYKAMRQYLIEQTESIAENQDFKVLTGYTGSAKTHLLLQFKQSLDLEGLANHRGSSFGEQMTSQPTQIDFENKLAIALLKLNELSLPSILIEDESRLIGSRSIPLALKDKMDSADLIMLNEPFEFRCEQIFKDYVVKLTADYKDKYAEKDVENYHAYLMKSAQRIKKRLGGVRMSKLVGLIDNAVQVQKNSGNLELHRDWIGFLLEKYYDPMYAFQLSKKRDRVIFEGNTEQVTAYISELH